MSSATPVWFQSIHVVSSLTIAENGLLQSENATFGFVQNDFPEYGWFFFSLR